MATIKQLQANRLNALKSTGPRTDEGKLKSRTNAVRHGLAAETVVGALENAADYNAFEHRIAADYQPSTATEQELVARLASVLWRLRRSTTIETGLLQIQADLLHCRKSNSRGILRRPEWYDEFDVAQSSNIKNLSVDNTDSATGSNPTESIAYCFLQIARLQYGAFDTLTRYETALWRQAVQLTFMLQANARR